MAENGGQTFTSLAHDNTFLGGPAKESGFLIEDIYSVPEVTVVNRPFTTALDMPEVGGEDEMAFIDANHQDP